MNPSGSGGSGGSGATGRGIGGRRGGGAGGRGNGRGEGRGGGLGVIFGGVGGLGDVFGGGRGDGAGGGVGGGRGGGIGPVFGGVGGVEGNGRGVGGGRGGGIGPVFGGGRGVGGAEGAGGGRGYGIGGGSGGGRGDGRGYGRGGRGGGRLNGQGRGGQGGGGNNNGHLTIDALLAQESRRLMPVLHPERLDGAMWFGLDNPPRRAIVASIRRIFDGPWYNISYVPNEALMQWWGDFIVSIGGHTRDGFGPHAHTSGSRSYDQLRELIRQKEGGLPSMRRILRETHLKADGSYVDDRARSIEEEIQREIDAVSQPSDGASQGGSSDTGLTRLQEDELFHKVVPSQNGRIFGLGGRNYIRERGESSAGAVERISLERQLTSLQEQLAGVVKFMKQYMSAGGSQSFPSAQPTNGTGASVTSPTQANNKDNHDANHEDADIHLSHPTNVPDETHEPENDDGDAYHGSDIN